MGEDVQAGIDGDAYNCFLRHGVVLITTMSKAVTQGIQVSVNARYTEEQSDPRAQRFLFSYRIRIENTGSVPVQLLRRHWHIHDSLGTHREVEGAGVVGEQPTLAPGEAFTYSSFCDLKSGFGRMHGTYLLRRLDDQSTFRVQIPPFMLRFPWSAN